MKKISYKPKAWETRELAQLYRSVGWSLNRKHIIALIEMFEPQSMLDVGCLEGTYIKKLRELGYLGQYKGVDITNKHIVLARENVPGENFSQADARKLPFPNQTFDLVLFSDVIQHLDDHAAAMNEVCRVSSKYVILSTYGTSGATFTRHSESFLNTYFNQADILKLIPSNFIVIAFADLPHPTLTLTEKERRIHHFVLQRK